MNINIQCDVCSRNKASVFCSAEEAVLCHCCDHRLHFSAKHQRFPLIKLAPKQPPLCDICQEKRALFFCQQDRAILCEDCDMPIHRASQSTKKHTRSLFPGVKLSTVPVPHSSSSSSSSVSAALTGSGVGCDQKVSNFKSQNRIVRHVPVSHVTSNSPHKLKPSTTVTATVGDKGGEQNKSVSGGGATTSISKYLIEVLPGWQVEDFLDPSYVPSGFSKIVDDSVLLFDDAYTGDHRGPSCQQNMGCWEPEAAHLPHHPSQTYSSSKMGLDVLFKDESIEAANKKYGRKKKREAECFAVPDISPWSTACGTWWDHRTSRR